VDIQLTQIIFQVINFSIIVFVLLKFLYKPVLKVLEQRSQKIEAGILAAEKNIKSQEEMDQTINTELENARKEAAKIIADAKKSAQKEAAQILSQAKLEAKKQAEKEQQSMIAGLEQERANLEASYVDMVTSIVRQLLHDKLKPADQKAIIESQIKSLKSVKLT
jgi:F-type H+-transporting ATPase subunit b